MMCDKCAKNEATFYLEQNINGKITKLALCPECAKEYKSINYNPYASFNILGGLFQPVGYMKRNSEIKKCTLCASTFADISKNGKVGCAECYTVFKDELNPTIKRIHGSVKHIGRKPYKAKSGCNCDDETGESVSLNENIVPEDQIVSLKNQLNEAVLREDYETAAVLRDKIRELSE